MEHTAPQHQGKPVSSRIFVVLVGGTSRQRASICHSVSAGTMHVEPVSAAGELGLRDLTTVDVLLAWDEGDTLEQLKVQLSIVGRWAPIIAVGESPPTTRVVRAIKAGAIDYINWEGDVLALQQAVSAASTARIKLLPLKQRQMEVRRLLRTLSPREQQVLNALAEGKTNKEIANLLGISCRTVEIHRGNLMKKLQASNGADVVRMWLEGSATAEWIYGNNWLAPCPVLSFGGGNDNEESGSSGV